MRHETGGGACASRVSRCWLAMAGRCSSLIDRAKKRYIIGWHAVHKSDAGSWRMGSKEKRGGGVDKRWDRWAGGRHGVPLSPLSASTRLESFACGQQQRWNTVQDRRKGWMMQDPAIEAPSALYFNFPGASSAGIRIRLGTDSCSRRQSGFLPRESIV